MNITEVIALAVIAVLLVAAAAFFVRARHTAKLRSQFGAEYDRALEAHGGMREAEAELARREERVRGYDLKALDPRERDRFAGEWRMVQASFVDDPEAAEQRADELLSRLMTARGYPDGDLDGRLHDLSVDHAEAVRHYREAHQTALKCARGAASTEDMRQAMMGYRALYDDLVS